MSKDSFLETGKQITRLYKDLKTAAEAPIPLPNILGDAMQSNMQKLLVAIGGLIEWSKGHNEDDEGNLPDAADELQKAVNQVMADNATTKVGGFDKTQLALIALHRAATGYRDYVGGDPLPELEAYIRQADELMGLVPLTPVAK